MDFEHLYNKCKKQKASKNKNIGIYSINNQINELFRKSMDYDIYNIYSKFKDVLVYSTIHKAVRLVLLLRIKEALQVPGNDIYLKRFYYQSLLYDFISMPFSYSGFCYSDEQREFLDSEFNFQLFKMLSSWQEKCDSGLQQPFMEFATEYEKEYQNEEALPLDEEAQQEQAEQVHQKELFDDIDQLYSYMQQATSEYHDDVFHGNYIKDSLD